MRKLAWTTVGVTFFLMIWGNLVSSTGSGLACPDWPTCHGTFAPPMRPDIVMEWGHRLLAALAGVLMVATVAGILREPALRAVLKKTLLGFLLSLLGIQILLGGITVLLELPFVVSTTHLVIAHLIWAGFILLAGTISSRSGGITPLLQPDPKLKRLAISGLVGVLVQIAIGGVVRHSHSGLACPSFPLCTPEGFFPTVWSMEAKVAFIHRWWGVLLLGVFVQLVLRSRKAAPELTRLAGIALTLIITQILLGVGVIHMAIQTHVRATHAALGYGIWGVLVYFAWRGGVFARLLSANPGR